MRRYQPLLKYIAKQRLWFGGVALFTVASAATAALQPLPMKLLVDYALGSAVLPAKPHDFFGSTGLDPTSPAFLIFLAAAASLCIFIINIALSAGLTLSWTMAGQRAVYDLAADVFARLERLSLRFHSRHQVGDSLSRLSGDTWAIYSVARALMTPLKSLVTLAIMGAVGFALDPVLAALCLLVAPFLAASARFFGKRLKRRARQSREASSRIASLVQQTLSSMPVVQTFGTEERNRQHFEDLADDAVEIAQRGRLVNSAFGLVNGSILTTGTARSFSSSEECACSPA